MLDVALENDPIGCDPEAKGMGQEESSFDEPHHGKGNSAKQREITK